MRLLQQLRSDRPSSSIACGPPFFLDLLSIATKRSPDADGQASREDSDWEGMAQASSCRPTSSLSGLRLCLISTAKRSCCRRRYQGATPSTSSSLQ